MAWTAPRTWAANELVTETLLNTHLKDNLLALKDPPSGNANLSGGNYSIASASFAIVDGGDDEGELRHTITIVGTRVEIGFSGCVLASAATMRRVYFNVSVDSTTTPFFNGDGIVEYSNGAITGSDALVMPVSFVVRLTGLTPGQRVFRLLAKRTNGNFTLYAGSDTDHSTRPQFWVVER